MSNNQIVDPESGLLKSKSAEEMLAKIDAKEEVISWNPQIVNEKLVRASSFVCADYHRSDSCRSKPKMVSSNPWICQSQACRQMILVQRLGPKRFYLNNQNIHNIEKCHIMRHSTQAIGLCYEPKTVSSL